MTTTTTQREREVTAKAWADHFAEGMRNEVAGPKRPIEISHANAKGEWRALYRLGDVLHSGHPDGEYKVDEQFFDDMLTAFEWFAEQYDYYPPILAQHGKDGAKAAEAAWEAKDAQEQEALKDIREERGLPREPNFAGVYALSWGLITDMRVKGDAIEAYHQYAEGVGEMVEQGKLVYTSPTHALTMTDPHTGKEFTNALAEVSFVRRPQLRNIGMGQAAHHYVLNEYGFIQPRTPKGEPDMGQDTNVENEEAADTTSGVENMDETENADGMEQLAAMIQELMDRVAALEGGDTENMGDEDEAENADEEEAENADTADASDAAPVANSDQGDGLVNELQHTVVRLEKQLAAESRKRKQEFVGGQLGKETPKPVREALSHLSDKDLDTVLGHFAQAPTMRRGDVEYGEIGNGSTGSEVTLEHMRDKAEAAGVDRSGLQFINFVRETAPTVAEKYLDD